MSLLHTCYELAKNLLSTCYASPRSKFIFLRERISDKWRFLLVWPKENMQRLYHSGRAFLLPKKLEKCRKRAAETSEFCRSLSEYEMYLTKAKCAASYLWWDNRNANSKISAAANAVKFKSQLPKVSFGKACIKSFVLENAEGKGKCRSIYALIFFLLFVQSAQIGDKYSQNK